MFRSRAAAHYGGRADPVSEPMFDPEVVLRAKQVTMLARTMSEAVTEALRPLIARIEALEACRLEYTGVWEPKEYRRGEVCTFDGSMWFCKATTRTQLPGDYWQLCVKRGRDAR
jgi:hypothetical protein